MLAKLVATAVRGLEIPMTHSAHNRQKEDLTVDWVWEILRYVAAWGGTGLIIWFWYWMFSNIGTF